MTAKVLFINMALYQFENVKFFLRDRDNKHPYNVAEVDIWPSVKVSLYYHRDHTERYYMTFYANKQNHNHSDTSLIKCVEWLADEWELMGLFGTLQKEVERA